MPQVFLTLLVAQVFKTKQFKTVGLIAGNTFSLDIQFRTCGGNYNGVGEAWIDFNQNQAFDASESIGQSSGAPNGGVWVPVVSFTFTVPPTVTIGNNPLNPCGTFSRSSVVDFPPDITAPKSKCPFPVNLVASSIS